MNKLIIPFSINLGGSMNISIFGSCVTRDIFNYINEEDDINLIKYYARSSIISVTSKSLNKSIYSIDLKSKFQRKMVYNDINKLFFSELNDDEIDIFLIDFIDERLDIIKIEEDQYLTRSNEFNSTVEFKKRFKGDIIKEEDRILLWQKSIDTFINNAIRKINQNKIFINECYYCERYIDKNGEEVYFEDKEYIKRKNNILKSYYNYIANNFRYIKFIKSEKIYMADENHMWGLSPFHYEKQYYLDLIKNIKTFNRDKEERV